MFILLCTNEDIPAIIKLYENARQFQKIKGVVLWPVFDINLIEAGISEKRQWKIIIDNQIACVWTITFEDPQIWEDRNNDPSIYIHRIAANPIFKGKNLVEEIVKWSRVYAHEHSKLFIRMDTVGENKGLINHYQKCGFNFLGLFKLKNTNNLPAHYNNATVCLFQISLDKR